MSAKTTGGEEHQTNLKPNPEEFLNGRNSFQMIPSDYSPVKEPVDGKIPIEELLTRTLPDYLRKGLDMVFIGINPGLVAAEKGRYYAGSGNHFWKCLYGSGIISEQLTSEDDYRLPDFGIGLTNIVERTTRGSGDLKPQEIKEGAQILLKKLQKYQPKIAVFNGKEIYRIFSGRKEFSFGKQPGTLEGTADTMVFVMPSSSARCAQLPRITDKIPFFEGLKKLRDYCRGNLSYLSEEEITFCSALKTPTKRKSAEDEEENSYGGRTTPPLPSSVNVNGTGEGMEEGEAGALDLSAPQGTSNPNDVNSAAGLNLYGMMKKEQQDIFNPNPFQQEHFSGSIFSTTNQQQQEELERLLGNSPSQQTTSNPPSLVLNQQTTSTSPSSSLPSTFGQGPGFNNPLDQAIQHRNPASIYGEFQREQSGGVRVSQQQSRVPVMGQQAQFDPTVYGFGGEIKQESSPSASATQGIPPSTTPLAQVKEVKEEAKMPSKPEQDMDLVSQHIKECVAAVVQRCKDGTQDFPEHYIRPSSPPGSRAVQQHQQHQQQQQQHQQHQQSQQQQHQVQQHHAQVTVQNIHSEQPAAAVAAAANQLLGAQVYQVAAQNRSGAANPVSSLESYLNPYFNQQQQQQLAAAAAYGNPLQRAMQAQWPGTDFYNALSPYFQQQPQTQQGQGHQQQQQQAQSQQQQQQQQQQFRQSQQQAQVDLYGAWPATTVYGQQQAHHGSQQSAASGQPPTY